MLIKSPKSCRDGGSGGSASTKLFIGVNVVTPCACDHCDRVSKSTGSNTAISGRSASICCVPASARRLAPSCEICVIPSSSSRSDSTPSRRYISSSLVTDCGDHNRSAIAAVRGQMRESIVRGSTYSFHMHASPPRIRAACSGVKSLLAGNGSTL